MRIATTALLATSASAALFDGRFREQAQRVLSNGQETVKPLTETVGKGSPLKSLEDALKGLTSEASALWEEVRMLVPDFPKDSAFFSLPKKHQRRPDSHWDHIIRGQDIQKISVQGADSERRKISGRLENYNLRAKKVDPSKLGVDKVKQYSGYLDDEANDKHLFYCKQSLFMHRSGALESTELICLAQGSLSPATTPRTTQLFCG